MLCLILSSSVTVPLVGAQTVIGLSHRTSTSQTPFCSPN